jgi:hypothetical protein
MMQAERKRKKAGAAANHAKVAEKLFAAQMRSIGHRLKCRYAIWEGKEGNLI